MHEFPGSDTPYVEDLGKASASYRFRAYVVGGDYMEARDKLIATCNSSYPATLAHPYLGKIKDVRCKSCTVNESSADGGVAWFDLEFVPAPEAAGLTSEFSWADRAQDLQGQVDEQAAKWYDDLYDLKDDLQSLSDTARDKVLAVASALRKINNYLDQVGAMGSSLLRSITELEDQVDALIAQPGALAGTFSALFDEVGGLLEQLFGSSSAGANAGAGSSASGTNGAASNGTEGGAAASSSTNGSTGSGTSSAIAGSTGSSSTTGDIATANPIPAAAALEPMLRFNEDTDSVAANNARGRVNPSLLDEEPLPEPDELADELSISEQEAINNRVVEAGVRLMALAQMPRAFASLSYLPPVALAEYQELCSAALEDMLAVADSNSLPLVRELQDLMLGQLAELRDGASFRELKPLTDLPALVLAHREYGNIDRADEIVALNGLGHPGFCAGGEALVLRA